MYTDINFKTKKALKGALKAGTVITTYQPGGQFEAQRNGRIALEGPHYPEPHRWYASAIIENGIVVKVTG